MSVNLWVRWVMESIYFECEDRFYLKLFAFSMLSQLIFHFHFLDPRLCRRGPIKSLLCVCVCVCVCLSVCHDLEISVTTLRIFLIFSEMKEKNISRILTEPDFWKKNFLGLQGSKRGIFMRIWRWPITFILFTRDLL